MDDNKYYDLLNDDNEDVDLDIDADDDEMINIEIDPDVADLEEVNLPQYIKESFLESVLNEDAIAIDNELSTVALEGTCTLDHAISILESIIGSKMDNNSKALMLREFAGSFAGAQILAEEYKGNPEKNAQFIKVLNLMEKYAKDWIDELNLLFKYGDNIIANLKAGSKAKKVEDARKYTNNIRNDADKLNATLNGRFKEVWNYNNKNFAEYKKLYHKFNNRYSTEVLAVKKDMDKKLDKLKDQVWNGEIRNWLSFENADQPKKWNELVTAWEALKDNNRDEAQAIVGYINAYTNYLVRSFSSIIGFINYIRATFDIEIENSFKFNFVQKHIKAKGQDNSKSSSVDFKKFTLELK